MSKKPRSIIPPETAAKVLFAADRTCCVCRVRAKPVQIHHLDENPSNHQPTNLAVLCFDCHRETQIRGGFDRKLDGEQVILYRDDWIRVVAKQRSRETAAREAERARDQNDLALATSLAEIYRESKAYVELAIHYNTLGNKELRDKYIELAIQNDPSDEDIVFLRGLQGRPDLIPSDVADRYLKDLERERHWHNRARALKTLGRTVEAAQNYILSIRRSLEENRPFSAAYYMRELTESGLADELYMAALAQAREQGDLWWQVRALQELGWDDRLTELILENQGTIDAMELDDGQAAGLKELLAEIRGDETAVTEIRKTWARIETSWMPNTAKLPNEALQPPSRTQRSPKKKLRARAARG